MLCQCFLILAASAGTALAQRPTPRALPAPQACNMSAKLLIVRLQTSTGAPISDATVTVQRVSTKAMMEDGYVLGGGQGSYKVFEDGIVRDLRPEGEPFEVAFTRGGRTHRVRLMIGMDANRCHVEIISGPMTITFPDRGE